MGLLVLAPIKPVVGDHEYVKPSSDATPICLPLALELQVLVKSSPALATTAALFTVTVTSSVSLQPVEVLVLVTV